MNTVFKGAYALVLATLLCFDASAAAKTDKQRALKAFKTGVNLYQAGDMEGAVKKFRYADALHPSWKIKYNIGQCEAALKRYGEAIEAFEQYLGQGGDDVTSKRRDEVLAELDRLRRMVGTITVTGEPGIDVYVGMVKRANTSVRASIKVTAGVEHEISFVKNGEKLGTVKLIVSAGEVVSLPTDTQQPKTVAVSVPGTPAPTPPVKTIQPPAASPTPKKAPVQYTTMRQLKDALRSGKITRETYRAHQQKIRKWRAAEYEQLKAELRAGKITRREYKTRASAVRRKYEGN
ncbi:MAG: tetratricopeptide repeat protein [Myxococcota bacterium]|nr:tetratricopeptide repeat protein [Myxococcota bacterium]